MNAPSRFDSKPVPVIIDTDAGGDIDDTWALAMLMRCPELQTRLVLTSADNAEFGADYVAKFLQAGGYDAPIGIGLQLSDKPGPQHRFCDGFDRSTYAGDIFDDGIDALIKIVMGSPEPMTLLAIGPCHNIAEALRREPRIATKLHYVGMQGSIREASEAGSQPIAEYNVVKAIDAAQDTFSTNWLSMTITPLDTCEKVILRDDLYREVRSAMTDPLIAMLMHGYDVWAALHRKPISVETESSRLFDTVAVYLCFAESVLEIEPLPLTIDDGGYMRIDSTGREVRVASKWRDQSAFERLLVDRLIADR